MIEEQIRQAARDCFLAGFDNDDVNLFIHVELKISNLAECQYVKEIMIDEYEKLCVPLMLSQVVTFIGR